MKKYYIMQNGHIKYDACTTWTNNSKWSWLIPVLCVVIVGMIEAL